MNGYTFCHVRPKVTVHQVFDYTIGNTYNDKLRELGILSLMNRRKYFDLLETFKCIRGYSNVNYRNWFMLVKDIEVRSTRGRMCPLNIIPNRARLDVRANFFSNRVVTHWNSLPDDMRELSSLESFKYKLKSMLLESESSGIVMNNQM